MKLAPIPPQEAERLTALRRYSILDSAPEEAFDRLTSLVASICQTKIALISLVDENRQWFKSAFGLKAKETPRDISFCGHAIMGDDLFLVEDAALDERFCDNPLFLSEPHVRFYAGMPLVSPQGFRLGTLCVIDSTAKKLNEVQKHALQVIAQHVVTLLELRLKNEVLQDISSQYAEVQKIAKTGGWELDIKTGETTWSEEVYHIYGLPVQTPTNKIQGISYYEPHERERISRCVEKCITEGVAFDEEFEFKDAQGILKWVRSTGKPVYNANKTIVKLVGIFQDISLQKQNQLKLLDTNQYLDLALEGASLGIWDWDLKNNQVRFDKRWAEMLGYKLEEIKMELSTWESKVHPDDLKPCFGDIQKYMNGEVSYYQNIHRMKHKDGHWVYILDRGKFSGWDKDNKPIRFTGTHLDITQQKMSEELMNEISKLRAAYISDADDLRKFFTYVLNQLLNLTESEYGFIGEISNDGHQDYLKTYAITDISWNEETKKFYNENVQQGLEFKNLKTLFGRVITSKSPILTNNAPHHPFAAGVPKGHPPLIQFMGVPLFFKHQMVAMFGVANRKSGYSQEFLNYLQPYLDVIAEMIHGIKMAQELEQQKMLSMHHSKLATIGQLAAGVGHEINNPLTIIQGQLALSEQQLNQQNILDAKLAERFSKIKTAILRISNIVKGLRTFARSDGTEVAPFVISQMISETVEMLGEIYQKDGFEIRLNLPPSDIYVLGNRGRLQQVLVNLITNAKDAMVLSSKRVIEVELLPKDSWALLTVRDFGVGIPEGIQDKIFDPFYTTKAVNQGTGIGLALARTIIKEHEGRIEFQSQKDEGTTFKVYLPITPLRPSGTTQVVARDSQESGRKILIVEDEPDIIEVLDFILKDLGHSTQSCSNAKEALKLIEKNSYDLVISDIRMPEMDGFEFLKVLRKLSLPKQPRFIFISGGVDLNSEHLKLIQNLSDGLLPKPFSTEVVQGKLKEILFS